MQQTTIPGPALPTPQSSIKERWIRALRSGKYQQEFGIFTMDRTANRFCCVGVLCRLYELETGKIALPSKIKTWSGWDIFKIELSAGNLNMLNDSGNWSFAELADLLERDL